MQTPSTTRRVRREGRTRLTIISTAIAAALLCAARGTAQRAATHSTSVWSVTFARNETSVATVARSELRLWAIPSGALACRLDGLSENARVIPDGETGFHVTLLRGDLRPIRAFHVEPATCAQSDTPVMAGAVGFYLGLQFLVSLPNGRIAPREFATSASSKVAVSRMGSTYNVTLPSGDVVPSESMATALDAGTAIYVCTASRRNITYYRATLTGPSEKIAESDADRDGNSGCGTLALARDSTLLLNSGDGAVVDLRRKRVIVSYPVTATSLGIDAARERLTIGYEKGVLIVDVRSRKPLSSRSDGNTKGYVSLTGNWTAIASSLTERPLVQLEARTHEVITLDDARSRPAADVMVASREAEVRERDAAARRERERQTVAQAQTDASMAARTAVITRDIAARYGLPQLYALMSQRRVAGAQESLPVDLKRGDMVVIVSDQDGVVTFNVSNDGNRSFRTARRPDMPVTGYGEAGSLVVEDIAGTLLLNGTGYALAHVFVVPRANVR